MRVNGALYKVIVVYRSRFVWYVNTRRTKETYDFFRRCASSAADVKARTYFKSLSKNFDFPFYKYIVYIFTYIYYIYINGYI